MHAHDFMSGLSFTVETDTLYSLFNVMIHGSYPFMTSSIVMSLNVVSDCGRYVLYFTLVNINAKIIN